MMHHRQLIESFPIFSNENFKFIIRSNQNSFSLLCRPPVPPESIGGGSLLFLSDDSKDYVQWWFNASTSQLASSGEAGTFCLDTSVDNPSLRTRLCNDTSETQKWTYDGDHIISSFNKACLSAALDLRSCVNGTSQEWSLYFSQGLPSSSIYGIQNNENGVLNEKRCIDVGGSDFTVGPALSMWTCTGGFNQRFWRPSSDLRIETALGFCIDWYNQTDIWLNYCSTALSQKWTYDGTYIKSVLDPTFCLSGDNINNRYSLISSTCTTEPRMQWKPYADTNMRKSFSIQSQYSKMCIDVPGKQFSNGQTLQIWECNDTPAQQFWRSDTTDTHLRLSSGKCIDWYQKQRIIVNECQDSIGQNWNFDGNSFSSWANSNICLSYQKNVNTRGAELTVASCDSDPRTQWFEYSYDSAATLEHLGDFSGFYFDMFRCPNNAMVTNVAFSYDYIADVILTLNVSCEDGSTKSFGKENIGDSASVVHLAIPSCRRGFTAVQQGADLSQALVCATPPSSSPNGVSYCPHSNTSRQRIIGANIWHSTEQFNGIEPVCGNILGNYGGDYFTFQCPPGSSLSKIDGVGNSRVNGLTVSCGTALGTNLTYGWTYHVGNTAGNFSHTDWCKTSIQGVTIWFDVEEALYGILPHCNGTTTQKIIGVQGGKEKNDFTCPTGTSLVGIHGLADTSNVYRLSFICGDASPPSNTFSFECPTGKRIVQLSSNSGDVFIQQIQAKCDDDTVSGSISNLGGNNTDYCPRGFTGAEMTYGENVGQIALVCSGRYGKKLGTTTSGNKTQFSCPNGQVIAGIKGTNRTGLEGLFFVCQPVVNQPILSSSDLAAIGYGLITGFVTLGVLSFVVWFISRRRHKERFQRHDKILPLR